MRTRNIGYVLPFILLSLLHILAIEGGEELLRVATKPFLIPALAWAYYRVTPNFYKLVLLALFFSFLGDVFLLGEGSLFFFGRLRVIFDHSCFVQCIADEITKLVS